MENESLSRAWQYVALVLLVVAMLVTVTHRQYVAEGDPRIYVEAAHSIGDGTYASASEPSGLPRYPPGFPIMLAPFVALWGDGGARAAATLLGALLVGLVWLVAARLGGHRAAAAAAGLWIASPLVANFSTGVISDTAGAVFVMLALLAAMRGRWLLAGLAIGWSSWIRLIHPVFLVGFGRRRAAWFGAILLLVPLAAFQLHVYGRLAGYEGGDAEFSLAYLFGGTTLGGGGRPAEWPNWQFFPLLLWGLHWGLVPLLPLFAGFELVARRAEPYARFAAWVIVANVAVYLPYYFQASRFVLPAACLVITFSAAGMVRLVDDIRVDRAEDSAPAAPERATSTH